MKQSISWWVLHKVKEGRTVNSRPIRRSAAIKFCDIDEERAIRPVFFEVSVQNQRPQDLTCTADNQKRHDSEPRHFC
jgi:hypothetical protein